MNEFEVGGQIYTITKMNVRQQWNVMRRVAPLLSTLGDLIKVSAPKLAAMGSDKVDPLDFIEALQPFADALSQLSDENSDYVINTCLACCQRKVDGQWKAVMINGQLMWQDIGLPSMLMMTWKVLQGSLSDFLAVSPGLSLGTPGANKST